MAESSPEELALLLFATSTLDLLTVWPALRLAISQGWGGLEGKTHLAEDIVDLFISCATDSGTNSTGDKIPDDDDIEAVLLHVLSHEFSLTLEDNSERLVARDLIGLWKECLAKVTNSIAPNTNLLETFAREAEKARLEDGVRTYAAQRDGESDDEEGEDDDDMDEDMDTEEGAEPASKPGPIIDEDGFEMVTKKSGKR